MLQEHEHEGNRHESWSLQRGNKAHGKASEYRVFSLPTQLPVGADMPGCTSKFSYCFIF